MGWLLRCHRRALRTPCNVPQRHDQCGVHRRSKQLRAADLDDRIRNLSYTTWQPKADNSRQLTSGWIRRSAQTMVDLVALRRRCRSACCAIRNDRCVHFGAVPPTLGRRRSACFIRHWNLRRGDRTRLPGLPLLTVEVRASCSASMTGTRRARVENRLDPPDVKIARAKIGEEDDQNTVLDVIMARIEFFA
jgi:hypothetical protein